MRLRARQARPYVRVRRTLAWLPRFTASATCRAMSGGAWLPRPFVSLFLCFFVSLFLCFFVCLADFLSHDEYFTTSYSTRRFEDLWMHWNKARGRLAFAAAAFRPELAARVHAGHVLIRCLPCPALPISMHRVRMHRCTLPDMHSSPSHAHESARLHRCGAEWACRDSATRRDCFAQELPHLLPAESVQALGARSWRRFSRTRLEYSSPSITGGAGVPPQPGSSATSVDDDPWLTDFVAVGARSAA